MLVSILLDHRLPAVAWEQLARFCTFTSLSGPIRLLGRFGSEAPPGSTPMAAQAYHQHLDQLLTSGPLQQLAVEALLLHARGEVPAHLIISPARALHTSSASWSAAWSAAPGT